MARNDVFLNINALSPADAVVTGQQDMTAATVPELVLGDTPTFNFYFTDNTNVWPSWAGNAAYTLTWALSDAVAGDFTPAATTADATPITGGWSVVLPLNAYDLVGLLNTKRVGQPYPVQNLWQQLRVADPSGNEVTRAMFWTPVRYRAISDTQNTESASPTGGRFVTVDTVNALQSPNATSFYAANPVPTSALGTAANGELLIGNGTGFVKSTLTAGTGITVTNAAGAITIDATTAQEVLTATVTNAESVAITKGQVVYIFGATGNRPSVKLAFNTTDATSAKTFGVVSDTSISAGGTGTVTCVGVLDGLNLGAYNDGETVYLGATPGSITNVKPYAPNHLVYVGIIERANMGNGELYVRIQNGYELEELHNVQITTPPLAGSLLMYDATNSLWKANRLTGGTNIAVTNADTSVTLGLTGTVAVANGGTGVTTSTGTGSVVLSNTPTLVTPNIGAATGTSVTLTGNATASDLILGTSGPRVKSSIAARAARQGLGYSGIAGANVTVSVAAYGTAAFTNAVTFSVDSLSAQQTVLDSNNGILVFITTGGSLQVYNRVGAAYLYQSASGLIVAGQINQFVYSRGSVYLNGVLLQGSISDTSNYTGTTVYFGGDYAGGTPLLGKIYGPPYIYNRALSAAEVVSLYEAGVPSGADYNNASNTALNTSSFENHNLYPYGTFSGASATGFTAVSNGSGFQAAWCPNSITIPKVGVRYRLTCTITLNSGTAPSVVIGIPGVAGYSAITALSAGANSVEIVATASGTPSKAFGFLNDSTASNYSVSGISFVPIGLLLAPDAAQAGGGLTWYDTSGNAANITLPASGVSWNVPSSLKVGGNWTFGGNLTVSGTGTNLFGGGSRDAFVIESDTAGNGAFASAKNAAANDYEPLLLIGETITLKYRSGVNSSTAGLTLTSTGNLLIGTTTDGGQKLQVNGTASFTDTITAVKSLNGDFSNFITNVNTGTASEATLYVSNAGTGATSATLGVTGTGYTTTGGFVQDAGVVSSGTGLSGGLSIMARAASSDIRFYAGAHTNLVATFASTGAATFAGTAKFKSAASLTDLSICASANTSTGLYFSASNAFSAIAGGAEVCAFAKDNLGSTGTSIYIANLSAAPSNNPGGGGCLYVEAGALKYRGSSGTVTTIANA